MLLPHEVVHRQTRQGREQQRQLRRRQQRQRVAHPRHRERARQQGPRGVRRRHVPVPGEPSTCREVTEAVPNEGGGHPVAVPRSGPAPVIEQPGVLGLPQRQQARAGCRAEPAGVLGHVQGRHHPHLPVPGGTGPDVPGPGALPVAGSPAGPAQHRPPPVGVHQQVHIPLRPAQRRRPGVRVDQPRHPGVQRPCPVGGITGEVGDPHRHLRRGGPGLGLGSGPRGPGVRPTAQGQHGHPEPRGDTGEPHRPGIEQVQAFQGPGLDQGLQQPGRRPVRGHPRGHHDPGPPAGSEQPPAGLHEGQVGIELTDPGERVPPGLPQGPGGPGTLPAQGQGRSAVPVPAGDLEPLPRGVGQHRVEPAPPTGDGLGGQTGDGEHLVELHVPGEAATDLPGGFGEPRQRFGARRRSPRCRGPAGYGPEQGVPDTDGAGEVVRGARVPRLGGVNGEHGTAHRHRRRIVVEAAQARDGLTRSRPEPQQPGERGAQQRPGPAGRVHDPEAGTVRGISGPVGQGVPGQQVGQRRRGGEGTAPPALGGPHGVQLHPVASVPRHEHEQVVEGIRDRPHRLGVPPPPGP